MQKTSLAYVPSSCNPVRVAVRLTDSYVVDWANLKAQVSELLLITDNNELNTLMRSLAERQFEPALWGESWRSFLLKAEASLF